MKRFFALAFCFFILPTLASAQDADFRYIGQGYAFYGLGTDVRMPASPPERAPCYFYIREWPLKSNQPGRSWDSSMKVLCLGRWTFPITFGGAPRAARLTPS